MTNSERAERLNIFIHSGLSSIKNINTCLNKKIPLSYKETLLKASKQKSQYLTKILVLQSTNRLDDFKFMKFYDTMRDISNNQIEYLLRKGVTI